MTEIKVITENDSFLDFENLTLEERKLIFEQIQKESSDISEYEITLFIEQQEEIINHANLFTRPTIKELLIRKIIQLSNENELNYTVIPIIKKAFTKKESKFMASRTKKIEKKEIKTIKVRFDTIIRTIIEDGSDYYVPPNEEIIISKLLLTPISMDPIYKNKTFRQKNPLIGNSISLGNFSYKDAAKSRDGYFHTPNYEINIAGEGVKSSLVISLDEGEKIVTEKLNWIFDYFYNLDNYYRLYSAHYIAAQLYNAVKKISGPKPQLIKSYTVGKKVDYVSKKDKTGKRDQTIIKFMETLQPGRFSLVDDTAFIFDLFQKNLDDIYYNILIRGKDAKIAVSSISKYNINEKKKKFIKDIYNKKINEQINVNSYLIIIERKYGSKRVDEINKSIVKKPSLNSVVGVLSLLKPNEKEPIKYEFERERKYVEEVINNKCAHVNLYKRFRKSQQLINTKKYYNELKKFFVQKDGSDMIKCNNCSFDIMCPHVRDITEMDLQGKSQNDIKIKLNKYTATNSKFETNCKICGEVISTTENYDNVESTRDSISTMDEELKIFIWSEVASLMRFLQFSTVVNTSKLITGIRDAIYPFIYELEKQILKSKTNTAEEIKAKKRLFISIYGFAYIIHIILRSKSISFKNFIQKNKKNILVDYIRHSIETINMAKNVIIREISGISITTIQNKLIDAYKSITYKPIPSASITIDIIDILLIDPVFKYIFSMHQLNNYNISYNNSKDVESIIGFNLSKSEKVEDIFENVKVPKVFDTAPFDNLSKKEHDINIDKKEIQKIQKGYIARSFIEFFKKIEENLHMKPIYVDLKSYDVEMIVDFTEEFKSLRKAYNDARNNEEVLTEILSVYKMQNYTYATSTGNRRFVPKDTKLGRIFDENGKRHQWKFILDKGESREEYSKKDLVENMMKSKHIKFNNKKCSICGILWSETHTLSDKKIKETISYNHTINNFFKFYDYRCPKGGLHELKELKCKKCNIDKSLENKSNEKLKYFQEFKEVYKKEKEVSIAQPAEITEKKIEKDFTKEYENWSSNFNILLNLSTKLKINQRIIQALGAVEKQDYALVQNGVYTPQEASSRYDTRIFVIESHIKNLIIDYNRLKYFHKLTKSPLYLSQLIDDSGFEKYKLSSLPEKLPDIYKDYGQRLKSFKKTKKPREIVAFCIEKFCEMCLIIYEDSNKETEKLRKHFVEYFINKIIRSEELRSKPGQFNMSILYGKKTKSDYDQNYDTVDEKDKYQQMSEENDENYGTTGTPFDVEENYDMEDSDDFEINVKGYGLD